MTLVRVTNQDEYDQAIEEALAAGHVIVMQRGFEIMTGPIELVIEQLVWRHVLLSVPTGGVPQ